jgi:hypothetical protein
MSEQMSAEELSDKLDSILLEYCNTKGILQISKNNEADGYISMTASQIKALTPNECGEAAYLIEQRAYFVQLAYNKENTRAKWAKSLISQTLADKIQNYKGYSYEERSQQAIKDNVFTQKLEKIRIMAQNRADILYSMSQRLSSLAKTITGLQYLKGNKGAD